MVDKISILTLLTNLAIKEAELMWTRYTTMLYASTALVGILSFALKEHLFSVVIGCALIGVVFSVIWLQMIRLSQFYYKRWQLDADELIKNDDNLQNLIRGRIDPRISPPVKWTASEYAMIVPMAFFVGWIFVLLGAINLLPIFKG